MANNRELPILNNGATLALNRPGIRMTGGGREGIAPFLGKSKPAWVAATEGKAAAANETEKN